MTALKSFGMAAATFGGGLFIIFALGVVGGLAGASDEDFFQLFDSTVPWLMVVAIMVGVVYYFTRFRAR